LTNNIKSVDNYVYVTITITGLMNVYFSYNYFVISQLTPYAGHTPRMANLALRINSEIGIILKGVRYGKYAQTKSAENDINA